MEFRHATLADLDDVIRVTSEGRAALAAFGLDQWQNGSPTPERLRADIEAGYTRVVAATEADEAIDRQNGLPRIAPGTIIGTVAFCPDGEADYSCVTQGAWLYDSPNSPDEARATGRRIEYVTLHRLATSAQAVRRGVASLMVKRCIDDALIRGFRSVRADTHEGNIPMQRTFEKLGMKRCCEIEISNPLEATKKRVGYEIVLW